MVLVGTLLRIIVVVGALRSIRVGVWSLLRARLIGAFLRICSEGAVRSIDLIGAMLRIDSVWAVLRIELVGALLRIDLIGALLRNHLVVGASWSIYIAVGTGLRTHILIRRSQEWPKDILCCIQVIRTANLNRTFKATTLGVLELRSW